MRISRVQMWMEIANVAAKRATCQRLSVGAVLISGRHLLSIGYNGSPAGEAHCLGNDCPGRSGCDLAIHAEVNALRHLPYDVAGPLDLYVTDSPCEGCYLHILEDGRIGRIFFATAYRVIRHLEYPTPVDIDDYSKDEMYQAHRVMKIYRVTPSGYVMNWRTKLLEEVET